MSTDAPFTPPKKKPNVLWWLGGGFVLLVLLFFLQLFGPNPRIIVSPQTTHITSPLGPDGLPDYEHYVLEESREGVTPENNAAVLLWQALWPGELDPPQYAAVAAELGLEPIPSASDSLQHLHNPTNRTRVLQYLRPSAESTQKAPNVATELDFDAARAALDDPDTELVDKVIDQSMSRPWTSEQVPPLAQWVAANKKPLDLLIEGSKRPRCYFPSPSLLNREKESLMEMLLLGVQSAREAGRSLSARAMFHLGEGRVDEAWQDLLAAHRIGRLTAQGPTLVEQMIGIAIHQMACEGTLALVDDSILTTEQARSIQRDLADLATFSSMRASIDKCDRLMFLDAVARQSLESIRPANSQAANNLGLLRLVSVDWNIAMIEGNKWFDKFAQASKISNRRERARAFNKIEGDLRNLELEKERRRGPSILLNRKSRSEVIASIFVCLMLPAAETALGAEDRANTTLELTKLASALAMYRTEHGAYPETLSDLVPAVVDKLPVDLYNAKPFTYKRDGEGYLLYSAGENGVDDGGSNETMQVFEGHAWDDLGDVELTPELQDKFRGDDCSIRVPRPAFEFPKLPTLVDR